MQPGDIEYEKLKRSFQEFGYVEPLIWIEQTGNLVGGHQRFKILVEQGTTEIEVSVVSLDEIREKALNIALNKISGAWDEEILA
ncbi:ParB N-terminal domain-containing protein [Brevibacillus brevis]|uniref:ParB N-terminal domain-containing protein n=1 Tax=Brevibacillus brevis TaxID=1393 RepID=UPI000A9488CD|nr:ParB N-terminal domain-containing protein [Brevibacillus brevis]